MKKLSKDNNGFGILELIIILVVVIVIAAGGYLVYKHNHKTMLASTTKSSSSSASTSNNTSNSSSANVVSTTFGDAPQALQTTVTNYLNSKSCFESPGQLGEIGGGTVSINTLKIYYTNNDSAAFNACDALSIYSYSGSQWQYDASTQDNFTCAQLLQYKFSSAVLNAEDSNPPAQCSDSSGNLGTYSTN